MTIDHAIEKCAKWVNILIEERKKNDDLLIKVALEAHMMGRIYNKMGEPETPAGYVAQLQKMVKILKQK